MIHPGVAQALPDLAHSQMLWLTHQMKSANLHAGAPVGAHAGLVIVLGGELELFEHAQPDASSDGWDRANTSAPWIWTAAAAHGALAPGRLPMMQPACWRWTSRHLTAGWITIRQERELLVKNAHAWQAAAASGASPAAAHLRSIKDGTR